MHHDGQCQDERNKKKNVTLDLNICTAMSSSWSHGKKRRIDLRDYDLPIPHGARGSVLRLLAHLAGRIEPPEIVIGVPALSEVDGRNALVVDRDLHDQQSLRGDLLEKDYFK